MNKYYTVLVVVIMAVLAILGGVYLYVNRDVSVAPTAPPESSASSEVSKGDVGYQESESVVAIGSEEVTGGTFVRVEGGDIYVATGAGSETRLPLTSDEVALQCTSQDLASATSLDFDLVENVLIYTPGELGSKLPVNVPIVVFSSDVNGVNTAHTVAIASSSCPTE